MNKLLKRLSKGPMIGAEGYLFELERRGWVSIGPFVPEVVIDSPDAVKQLHREFVRSGSDVIEAFTYYGHREKLRLINKEHLLEKLNYGALEIAMSVRDEFYSQFPAIYNREDIMNELFVAGNICNSTLYFGEKNTTEETKSNIRFQFEEQCEWAKEMNVDFIIGETYDYVEEAKIALESIKKVDMNMPCIINFAIHSCDGTLCGKSAEDACVMLADMGADVVGLNCARGPNTMMPLLRNIVNKMSQKGLNTPIAALPVCYKTNENNLTFQSLSNVGANENDTSKRLCDLDNHTCTRFDIYDFTKECLDLGIQYLGMFIYTVVVIVVCCVKCFGILPFCFYFFFFFFTTIGVCCGGAPHHVRSMAEAMGRRPLSSKYDPNLSLHYALGSQNEEKITNYL